MSATIVSNKVQNKRQDNFERNKGSIFDYAQKYMKAYIFRYICVYICR